MKFEDQLCDGWDEMLEPQHGPRVWVILAIVVGILAVIALPVFADCREAMCVVDGGCSGVVVTPSGIVLSAKHCDPPERVAIELASGQRVAARRLYVDPEPEGVIVFQAERQSAPYSFAPVAGAVPPAGSEIRILGYEGADRRNLVELVGTLTGSAMMRMDAAGPQYRANVADVQAMHGMSGGPAISSEGEVIGLISAGDPSSTVLVRHERLMRALQAIDGEPRRPQLVAFVSIGCAPCERFKADLKAGQFREYDVELVTWNAQAQTWSDGGKAFREARDAIAEIPKSDRAFPMFWLRGTKAARVGYRSERGLIQWIGEIVKDLGRFVFGAPPVPGVPPIDESERAPDPIDGLPAPPSPEPFERSELIRLRSEIEEVISSVRDLKADGEQFKDSGLIGKARLIDDLKRDVDRLRGSVSTVKKTASRIREDPLHHLWTGLIAALGGIIRRRFT